jgi:hypothetical protein
VTRDGNLLIFVFGEGKTDLGSSTAPELPTKGVIPILVSTICGGPKRMRVQREPVAFLQGKGLWQKVRCAKRKARSGDGAVFVVDSEGDHALHRRKYDQMKKGRDAGLPEFPMAIGIAHPCIESWLLADATAIRRGLELPTTPGVPNEPELLPAPSENRDLNPKTILREASRTNQKELSGREKDCITVAMNDLPLVRQRCPQGFAPFADEVENRIRPLF